MSLATAVVAVGGNALLRGGTVATIDEQFEAARRLAVPLRDMIGAGWLVVLSHGNVPQVGFILRRSDLVAAVAPELPRLTLDMCVADSQGSLGYILASTLQGEPRASGLPGTVVALLTHTVVSGEDPAFRQPSKPIGAFYAEETAKALAAEHGWSVMEDAGRGWRRVVPSPRPRRLVEQDAIRALVAGGFIVVAAGGGGIPVVEDTGGRYQGVEAVVDKDFTSALLAAGLGADLLVITTGVPQVAVGFGSASERLISRMDAAEAAGYLADGEFPPGSMGPKVEAALQVLRAGGREVLITSAGRLSEALDGRPGTWIVPGRQGLSEHREPAVSEPREAAVSEPREP